MTAVTSKGSAKVTLPSETTILIEREFNAPKELVFRAYTEPELISKWWTARRGSMTVCDVDLRVGGKWRYVMVTEGDVEVGFHGEYREIIPNERLVSTEVYEGAPGGDENGIVNTLTLTEVDGRTKLSVLCDCGTQFVRDMIIESGMEGGLQDAYDLLDEVAQSLD